VAGEVPSLPTWGDPGGERSVSAPSRWFRVAALLVSDADLGSHAAILVAFAHARRWSPGTTPAG
jgi:hypothetical protein